MIYEHKNHLNDKLQCSIFFQIAYLSSNNTNALSKFSFKWLYILHFLLNSLFKRQALNFLFKVFTVLSLEVSIVAPTRQILTARLQGPEMQEDPRQAQQVPLPVGMLELPMLALVQLPHRPEGPPTRLSRRLLRRLTGPQ